jgi:ArsR family transcriptional regulator
MGGEHAEVSDSDRRRCHCEFVLRIRPLRPAGSRRRHRTGARIRGLADPARLRVLSILAASPEGEVCVCDLVAPLGKSQPTVSHHLKILSDAGLIEGQRRGKWVWYSLNRDRLSELQSTLGSSPR